MDTHSSSDDDQVIKEVELHEEPIITSKSFPYQSLLVELHNLDQRLTQPWQEIWTLQQDVKLQQMIFMLLPNHGVGSQSPEDIQTMAETETEQILKFVADFKLRRAFLHEWKAVLSKIQETLHQKIKPHLKKFCIEIVDRLLQGNCSTEEYGIFAFLDVILVKLKDFKKLKPILIDPVKKQMQILEEMLNYALIIARKMTNLDENLQNFFEFFEPWVNTAAAIVIRYWVDEGEKPSAIDEMDEKPFAMVLSSLQKFDLSILEYMQAYFLVLEALRPSNVHEILVMRNAVEQFTKMILEKFIVSTDVRISTFGEGLAFWTTLLVDPPKSDAEEEKLICSQTYLLLDQAKSLIFSLCLKKLGEDDVEGRNTLLNDFLEKINKAKAEVRQLHVHQIPGLSWNNGPKTNTRGHFDFLLGNLQKKLEAEAGLFPFEKHLIAIIHEELSHLRPLFMDTFELQDEHKELRDIWAQASGIAYIVDYVTDFCLSSTDFPIWSNLMHLSNAIEKIQSIKTEVSKINQLYNNGVLSAKVNSQLVLPGRQEAYNATTKDDFHVGFNDEEQRIIDCLVAGEDGLNIVAIVGMPGQGKTHLAQRVFQYTDIKHRFTKLGQCCISQAYDIKKVLRDILEDVGQTVSPEEYQRLTQEDLAFQLRKCLSGQRYLVVLDDMWDDEAWCDLQSSFPDDKNGSRILLTSRNRNVLQVKGKCSIVELHPLSREESWDLLQKKVFHGDCCPPTLYEIGKSIAENCKGLPLAVVVVAGLLKKDKNVESWKKISESLKPLIASEGCMDIVELSYKHLPDYLKACFLYLGAFPEDQIIDAKQLIQFWIVEGFVQSDRIKTREEVAKEYLTELVSRSLIFVAQRSSRNGIKKCHVHDLLHQLCLIKVEEEKLLLVPNDVFDHSSTLYNGHFRISVHDKLEPFLDSKPIVPGLRSLLVSVNRFVDSVSVYDYYNPVGFLKEFKLIRVLDLRHAVTKADFDDILQLIHLRLLSVPCRFQVPPSIVNLLRLEVLRFYNVAGLVILPSVVIKMASLRHIFVVACRIENEECYDKLVPDMSSPLTNLETLTMVCFDGDELSFKRVAQSLPNILKFGCKCHFLVRLSSYFKKLQSLKLKIEYGWLAEGGEVISPSMLDFPLTLKKLNLIVNIGRLSGAMMSSIGKLNNLEVLKLTANFEDDIWDVEDDEFLQLKYLYFSSDSVQEWNVSDESFPCLEQLFVSHCYKLKELPDRFGSVATLRRIEVHTFNGSLSNSFEQIVKDQEDAGNEGLQNEKLDESTLVLQKLMMTPQRDSPDY